MSLKSVDKLPVLLLQLGEAPAPVYEAHGGYRSWFERAWEGPLALFDGRTGETPPDARDFAGVIVTGSPLSLVTPEPWMDLAGTLLERAHDVGTPVLGVCFGHQLLGRVFGGRVIENPTGWEIGSHDVDVVAEDPLFEGLGPRIRVNLTHRDVVEAASLPPAVRVLAKNAATDVQALAVSDHIRGVQFHPEIAGAVCRGYLDARRHLLVGQDPDALIAGTADSSDGLTVMRNFRRRFVEKA
jgi:GMP synthase (glutamine-hydrolysing)